MPNAATIRPGLTLQLNPWVLAPLALIAAVFAAPYLMMHGSPAPAIALYRGFGLICHQRPERCFWIFGAPIAVCARCLGIYVGAAIGLSLRTTRRLALNFLLAASALNLLDSPAEYSGVHGNWMVTRFCLGGLLGTAAALLISSSLPTEGRQPILEAEPT